MAPASSQIEGRQINTNHFRTMDYAVRQTNCSVANSPRISFYRIHTTLLSLQSAHLR
jgi:hypothetical protein